MRAQNVPCACAQLVLLPPEHRSTPSPPFSSRLKAHHAKRLGDAALASGNHRTAMYRYSDACLDARTRAVVLCNRAAAATRCGRGADAVADARAAGALAPTWHKPAWRLGRGLEVERDAVGAVRAFAQAAVRGGDPRECVAAATRAAAAGSPQNRGQLLLDVLVAAEADGVVPASVLAGGDTAVRASLAPAAPTAAPAQPLTRRPTALCRWARGR